jgi:succinate dehydrogenase / fumarate reductase, flavoprotein subunit
VSSRAAKRAVDNGNGVGPLKNGVYLDFASAIERLGRDKVSERYSNLFEMYERITDEDPFETPMRIYPAPHYTMGGLWVDYNLMTTVPGLYAIGEANFSDHGANRLGASALMQGLADGYFVLPYTIGDYLAGFLNTPVVPTDDPAFKAVEIETNERVAGLASRGTRTVDDFHRQLGRIVWDYCGMSRDAAGLDKAIGEIPALYEEFKRDVKVLGTGESVNQSLEKAGRVDDFFQLGDADVHRRPRPRGVVRRALPGGVPDRGRRGAPQRRRLRLRPPGSGPATMTDPVLHKEELEFENVKLATRSYK